MSLAFCWGTRALVNRWLRFNAVGALGMVVQFACFGLLFSLLRINYMAAAALAVEAAVLHNFVWHERFTWKERTTQVKPPAGGLRREAAMRLLRFHAGNGLVSILGNVALMHALVGGMHLNHFLATGISIATCSLLNFAVSEWFVYRI
ncbi:MAG TPA: GtrA family protein [Candidatus Acidoferrales bacterium]|nr:GtrA family protein [Candidatus Acidoferrales bacterium]